MRVNTLRIPCTDLGKSSGFYSLLLGQEPTFGDVGTGYIGFDIENVTILLEPVEPGEFESGRYLGFSLEVDDIRNFYESLAGQIQFSHPPREQPWGGIMTHVTDASGNTLSVVQSSRR